ncbi:MAG: AmmeMemoRadiSam system protein B [Promethearchaeota archaeon]
MIKIKRKPIVAGQFYPRFKGELVELIEACFLDKEFGVGQSLKIGDKKKVRSIIGGVCPHAGYYYSGAAAAHTIQKMATEGVPDTVVILGTQHTGYSSVALMKEGEWDTPLGSLEIDSDIAEALLSNSDLIINDESAFFGFPHGREHNIEVQLPFLKYMADKGNTKLKIVPIKVGTTNFKKILGLGQSIGRTLNEINEKQIFILASSDMTHKSPRNVQNPKKDLKEMRDADFAVIDAIKKYDWKKTLENALNTTVCGPQTITTAMIACKEMGATKSEFLKYYNSYEKVGGAGPCDYAVGYLSVVFVR